jgi:HSP20 family protein
MERDDWKVRTPGPRPEETRRREHGIEPTESEYGFHPFERMRRHSQDIERFIENWGFGGSPWPALEMFDRNDHWIVRVELPGMKRDDVHVRVVGNSLVIEGERRVERVDSPQRSEWRYGRFSREIRIPPDLDASRLTARMKEGVLELSVPYREGRQVREIRIDDGEASGTRH